MNESATQVSNPFEAPKSVDQEVRLNADTQFLISEDAVLCESDLELPAVCIFTGATTGVEKCEHQTMWYPTWVQMLRVFSIVFGMLSISVLTQVLEAASMSGRSEELIWLAGVSLLVISAFVLGRLFRRPIRMTWYIATSVKRRRTNQRIALLSITGVLATALVIVGTGFGSVAFAAVIPLTVVGLAVFRIAKRPIAPTILGRRDGLFCVGGLKKPFIRRVHQMIENFEPEN